MADTGQRTSIPTVLDGRRTRLISVLTAVHVGRTEWLRETAESLNRQVLPSPFSFEWIVQEDGESGNDLGPIVGSVRSGEVSCQSNRGSAGTATTRNLALSRAQGDYVISLDGDDMLFPSALLSLALELNRQTSCSWVAGRTFYLRQDGTLDPFPERMKPGKIAPGRFADDWLVHRRPSVCSGAVMYRREAVLEAGGWIATRGSEDTGMLLAISDKCDGYFMESHTLMYRKWAGSVTASAEWRQQHVEDQAFIEQILAARRAARQQ